MAESSSLITPLVDFFCGDWHHSGKWPVASTESKSTEDTSIIQHLFPGCFMTFHYVWVNYQLTANIQQRCLWVKQMFFSVSVASMYQFNQADINIRKQFVHLNYTYFLFFILQWTYYWLTCTVIYASICLAYSDLSSPHLFGNCSLIYCTFIKDYI